MIGAFEIQEPFESRSISIVSGCSSSEENVGQKPLIVCNLSLVQKPFIAFLFHQSLEDEVLGPALYGQPNDSQLFAISILRT